MITKTAVRFFPRASCTPRYLTRPCVGGLSIGVRRYQSNLGKHWTWPGSAPHPTRMHNYGTLSTGQKDDWKAIADMMNNGHSSGVPLPYSGAIAYMQTNLYRRLRGDAYTDDAPSGDPPAASVPTTIETITTSFGAVVADLDI